MALGSLMRPILKITQFLYAFLLRVCSRCILTGVFRHVCCIPFYFNFIRYFTDYNNIMVRIRQQSIFGGSYLENTRKTFFLIQRNRIRIGVPLQETSLVFSIISQTAILLGTVTTLSLILVFDSTPSSQLTVELVNPAGPLLFSLFMC